MQVKTLIKILMPLLMAISIGANELDIGFALDLAEKRKADQVASYSTYPVLLFVTTKNAPTQLLLDFIEEADELLMSTPNLKTIELFVGFDENFVDILAEIREQAQSSKEQALLVENRLDIRFDPSWIKALRVEKIAPVVALAECQQEAYIENCTLLARVEGAISVEKFLELAADQEVELAKSIFEAYLESKDE